MAVALSLTVINVARLTGFASTAFFSVDECWHALVTRIMAASGGLVTTTTEIMRDPYHLDYPPLFHAIGAALYNLFGPSAWFYLNIAIGATLLGFIVLGRNALVGPVERSALALALLATPLFAMYSLRFYVEMLTAALFCVSWWRLALVLQHAARRDAIVSGAATGLLVWTKQTGLLILAVYLVVWCWVLAVGPTPKRRAMTWLVGIAGLFSVTYLGVMWIRGENPLLFLMPTRHAEVWASAMDAAQVPYGIFFDTIRATWGLVPMVLLAVPVALLVIRGRRNYPYLIHLSLLAALILVFLVDRRLVERHTLFLLPLIAFLGVDALSRFGRPVLLSGAAVIALFATVHVVTMPNYRINFNPSRNFAEMLRVIASTTDPNATVVTEWWAEVRYHTGRQVLWPMPNLDDPPVDLFNASTADQWHERLRDRQIDYLLIDARYVSEEVGIGYSRPLLSLIPPLLAEGRLQLVAERGPLSLFRVS
ncbi:MAG: ArnT family glycosyltransferase [Nitrospirota bacterium]